MNYLESIILGIVQGMTEFLPVSSSGHLVIFENLLGIKVGNLSFEIFVHFGTLLSVLAIYYYDVFSMIKSFFAGIINPVQAFRKDEYFRLSIFVIIGTIPAALAGVFLEDFFTNIFHNVDLVGYTLIFTAVVLWSTRYIRIKDKDLNTKNSVLIGIAQMLAIFPGISRSGMTISTGLFSGISRQDSARFSFLLAIPAISGSMVFALADFFSGSTGGIAIGVMLTGLATAFIVGYLAIKFLLKILASGKFSYFAPYCLILAILVLLFL